jgi:type I restriction enzyme S subunit
VNWLWITLGNLVDIKRGASPRPIKAYITEADDGVNWIKIGDSDSGKYITHIREKITPDGAQKSVFVEKGTLLLSNSMSFGRPYILGVDGCIHDGWLAITPSDLFDKEYLYYALLSSNWYFEQVAVGTAVRNLNSERVASTPVILPPLPEQQRIVDRIESLFAKLDEAKEKAQAVVDGFKLRKSAILHQAFTGELTKEWRREHGVGMESWETRTLDSVCESIFDGDHMPPPKSEQGIPFLVISNVNNGHLSFENTRFVPQDYYDSLSNTRKPKIGDVLYTLVGSYGIPVVVDDEKPFCFQRHMALLKPKDVNTYFLWYLLQSQEMFNKASAIATGTAQLTVPIKGLRQMKFQRPIADEQAEIVRILDNLLSKEQQAKDAAENVLDKIDSIKKSILARAFRGQLGTNDPNEESAVKLLKEVL